MKNRIVWTTLTLAWLGAGAYAQQTSPGAPPFEAGGLLGGFSFDGAGWADPIALVPVGLGRAPATIHGAAGTTLLARAAQDPSSPALDARSSWSPLTSEAAWRECGNGLAPAGAKVFEANDASGKVWKRVRYDPNDDHPTVGGSYPPGSAFCAAKLWLRELGSDAVSFKISGDLKELTVGFVNYSWRSGLGKEVSIVQRIRADDLKRHKPDDFHANSATGVSWMRFYRGVSAGNGVHFILNPSEHLGGAAAAMGLLELAAESRARPGTLLDAKSPWLEPKLVAALGSWLDGVLENKENSFVAVKTYDDEEPAVRVSHDKSKTLTWAQLRALPR